MSQVEKDFKHKFDDLELFLDCIKEFEPSVRQDPILKASAILMLYNIMESTLRSLIVEIHDILYSYPFLQLNEDLQKNFIYYYFRNLDNENNFRKNSSGISILKDFSSGVLYFPKFEEYYNGKTLFSGNVDSKKINEIFDKYTIKKLKCKEQLYLKKVKDYRNILAHGNNTFSQVGRVIVYSELQKISSSTKICLQESINNTLEFLNSKAYLNSK